MNADFSWPALVAGMLLAAVPGTAAGIWLIIHRRGGEKVARRSTLPPTWPEMWARIDAQEKRIDALEEELRLAHSRTDEAEARAERSDQQALEMITHIVSLEQMVPNPPGPPQRPNWKLPILGNTP